MTEHRPSNHRLDELLCDIPLGKHGQTVRGAIALIERLTRELGELRPAVHANKVQAEEILELRTERDRLTAELNDALGYKAVVDEMIKQRNESQAELDRLRAEAENWRPLQLAHAEVDRLRAALERIARAPDAPFATCSHPAIAIEALAGGADSASDGVSQMELDAIRYQWLRERCGEDDGKPYAVFYDKLSQVEPPVWRDILDRMVDEAIRASDETTGEP